MYKDKSYPKTLLLRYLNQYLSKRNLRMKFVIRNIKNRIENDQPITLKQLNSVIKFIAREAEFRSSNRDQIIAFFEPIIERKVNTYGNDLTEHFIRT